MRRRLFTVASVLSLLLCLATVVLWVRSQWAEDQLSIRVGNRALAVTDTQDGGLLFGYRNAHEIEMPIKPGIVFVRREFQFGVGPAFRVPDFLSYGYFYLSGPGPFPGRGERSGRTFAGVTWTTIGMDWTSNDNSIQMEGADTAYLLVPFWLLVLVLSAMSTRFVLVAHRARWGLKLMQDRRRGFPVIPNGP